MYSYVKDKFVKSQDAVISIDERGFRFGDGIFETCRVDNGNIYQFSKHLKRLNTGCKSLKINFNSSYLFDLCCKLIKKNNTDNCILRISISRGSGSAGYLPNVKDGATLIIQTLDLPDVISSAVDLWLCENYFIFDNNLSAGIKTMQGLNYSLAKMTANENNCYDALMIDSQKRIREASSSNIFWVKNDIIYTPQIYSGSVNGVTRQRIIDLWPYKVIVADFNLNQIKEADEVFITNIAQLVLSVKTIKPWDISFCKSDITSKILQIISNDIKACS